MKGETNIAGLVFQVFGHALLMVAKDALEIRDDNLYESA
jgi:hypothetical protein